MQHCRPVRHFFFVFDLFLHFVRLTDAPIVHMTSAAYCINSFEKQMENHTQNRTLQNAGADPEVQISSELLSI